MNLLSLNLGSSSLKFTLYRIAGSRAEEIVQGDAALPERKNAARSGAAAAIELSLLHADSVEAVGHRIVFGGELDAPCRIDECFIARLESLQKFDPLHLPGQIAVIRAALDLLPDAMHAACFDTALFSRLPEFARTLPLPRVAPRLRRYGFHGLSYASVLRALKDEVPQRTIVAHLGNGASAAAFLDGAPVNTTMGFSPLGGLLMSTRPGDLDPGAILYLMQHLSNDQAALRNALSTESGLRAVSGGESDLRALVTRTDESAKLAVEMFVRSAARAIAGLATDLGGLDLLVFTGGIGEHNEPVRSAITARVAFLKAALRVRVVTSDENGEIARITAALAGAETEAL